LTWPARVLARDVHRDCRTADGTEVSIWAYPCGIPPRRWREGAFTPAIFILIQDGFAYLRYRIKHRGSWVVEIREHSFERIVADGVFLNRSSAMDQFEKTRRQLSTLRIAEIGQAALGSPARPG